MFLGTDYTDKINGYITKNRVNPHNLYLKKWMRILTHPPLLELLVVVFISQSLPHVFHG